MLAALIHMEAEGRGLLGNIGDGGMMQPMNVSPVPWETCVGEVILGLFDVTSIIEDYADLIKNGAKWKTIRPFLKNALKRYGGWVTVGILIYDINDRCF